MREPGPGCVIFTGLLGDERDLTMRWRASWLRRWVRRVEIALHRRSLRTRWVTTPPADVADSRAYRIVFDNGALFTTYRPAPWAIELTRGD